MLGLLGWVALACAPSQVAFSLEAPSAQRAQFVGDLTGWDRPVAMERSAGTWRHEAELPPDARVEYQFIVDGKWMLDPKNPKSVDNGVGGRNSVYEGPEWRASAPLQDPQSPMRRIDFSLPGGPAPKRSCILFVPAQTQRGYPVIVYADGLEYDSRLHAPTILQNLVEAGRVRPAALLLIPPVDRIQEYARNTEGYERLVVEQALPLARRLAPISRKAADVYVGGASLGGVISLKLMQNFPKVVAGGAHLQSGAFWIDPGLIARSSLGKMAPGARVFVDWGRYEGGIGMVNEKLCRNLQASGLTFKQLETPEGHNWTAWRQRFGAALEFLLGKRPASGP